MPPIFSVILSLCSVRNIFKAKGVNLINFFRIKSPSFNFIKVVLARTKQQVSIMVLKTENVYYNKDQLFGK